MAAREALLALVVLTIAPAGAGIVTLCNSDTQGGPGAPNLQTAVAAGGDVTFQCAPGAVIHLTQGHSVTRDVRVNGGNRVTLDGGDHVMFIVQ